MKEVGSKDGVSTGGAWGRLLLCCSLSGILVGLLDGFLNGGAWRTVRLAWLYDVTLCVVAAVCLGALSALLWTLGTTLAVKFDRPALKSLPLGIVGAFCFVRLNQALFDGPWIQSQSWSGAAWAVFIPGGAVATLVLFHLLPRFMAAGGRGRFMVLGVSLLLWGGMGYANLSLFDAYPRLKLEFALLTWLGASGLVHGVLWNRNWKPAVCMGVVSVLFLGAVGASVLERRGDGIHRVRGAITGLPLPAGNQVISLVEPWLFDWLSPIESALDHVEAIDFGSGSIDRSELVELLDKAFPDRRRFNVLWIAVDALRADHLGCFGYGRNTSPRLDELAKRSQVFPRAITPTPASNFAYSGTMHGVFGRISPAYYAYHQVDSPVPGGHSFVQVLRDSGMRTLGLTSFHDAVQERRSFRGLKEGFDVFNSERRSDELPADEVTDNALELIDKYGFDSRFFMWVHYMDPHGPYIPHDEFEMGSSPVDVYDSEIAYADREIGRLLDGLKEKGLARETVVFLFGDHGESFGEHNNWRHGTSLHQHQVHIPLIVHIPGLPQKEIKQWVSLTDLAPTTMSLLGVEDPHRRLGRDLLPLTLGRDEGWVDVTYADRPAKPTESPPSVERGVWSGRRKLLWKPSEDTIQVFDLEDDPGETRNIFDPKDPAQKRLLGLMKGMDAAIDTFWGGSAQAAGDPSVNSPRARFARAVESFVAADSVDEKIRTLGDLISIFNSPGIRFKSQNRGRLDEEALATLLDHLEVLLPEHAKESRLRDPSLRILIFDNKPRWLPLVRSLMDSMRPSWTMLQAAYFRARHRDESVKPLLELALSAGKVSDRVRVASGLAMLGDDRGRELLRAAMYSPRLMEVEDAIRGLGSLDDAEVWSNALFNNSLNWRKDVLVGTACEAAMGDRTPVGNAMLMLALNVGGDATRAKAADELRRRFGGNVLRRASEIYGSVYGARESIRYQRYPEALAALGARSREDDDLMGPLWWLKARSAWELEQQGPLESGLQRLLAANKSNAAIRDMVVRVRKYAAADPHPPLGDTDFGVEILGADKAVKPNQYFVVKIRLLNRTDRFVAGGFFPQSPRIGFGFASSGGEARMPAFGRHLPLAGLEPGESLAMDVLGRTPPKAGVWVPQLRLYDGPRPGNSIIVFTGPPTELK